MMRNKTIEHHRANWRAYPHTHRVRPVFSLFLSALAMCMTAKAEGLIASNEPGWPQWRGPRRDGVSNETNLLSGWPADGPTLLWKTEHLGRGWSSPIVVEDHIYITGDVNDHLSVHCLDTAGTTKWRVTNGEAWKGPYPGSRASCAYSNGRLYHLNAHGRLACLEVQNGNELWAVNILDRFGAKNITWALSECVLVDADRVIVTPGGPRTLMAALDKESGQTIWTTPPIAKDQASHSSPILFEWADRRIIANCSSAHGFGVDADSGEMLWTVPLKNPHGVNAATPIYQSGVIFYVTPYAELGRAYQIAGYDTDVTVEHLWTCPLDTVTGSGVLVENTLFAAGYKSSKWWFAVDWRTGKTKYVFKGLTTGAPLWADGLMYCLDERGTVALIEPVDTAFRVRGRFRLPVAAKTRDAWAHPVINAGRLYLRYHDRMWCYDIQAR